MSNKDFFTISGLACAKHTPETRKKWDTWENKTEIGREAVIKYAQSEGFVSNGDELAKRAKDAFNYLLSQYPPNMFGAKSHIIREAIINYS